MGGKNSSKSHNVICERAPMGQATAVWSSLPYGWKDVNIEIVMWMIMILPKNSTWQENLVSHHLPSVNPMQFVHQHTLDAPAKYVLTSHKKP